MSNDWTPQPSAISVLFKDLQVISCVTVLYIILCPPMILVLACRLSAWLCPVPSCYNRLELYHHCFSMIGPIFPHWFSPPALSSHVMIPKDVNCSFRLFDVSFCLVPRELGKKRRFKTGPKARRFLARSAHRPALRVPCGLASAATGTDPELLGLWPTAAVHWVISYRGNNS